MLLVGGLTALAFLPALHNGFVEWDDNVNLYENPAYRGLGWKQIHWMLTTGLMGHYIPVTWFTFGLDFTLWGMNPSGYHLTSLVLHVANAALFFLVALRLLRAASGSFEEAGAVRVGALVAALLFSLHPLRVESVVWLTERRDVLSGFFFLLTMLAYLEASRAEGRRRRWLLAGSLVAYALAMGSKSVVMVVPVLLIVLDLYPLRRLPAHPGQWFGAATRSVWWEKIPFTALAVVGAAVSYYTVSQVPFLSSFERYPWPARVAIGSYNLAFYLWKTPLPVALSPLYRIPRQIDPFETRFIVSLAAVVSITVALLVCRRRWPAGLAAWTGYVALLAPVCGFAVHGGPQLATDRYSYLPSLALSLLAGAGAGRVVLAMRSGVISPVIGRLVSAAAVLVTIGLGVLSWQQTQVWHDTGTLWRHALDLDPDCDICHHKVGALLAAEHRHGPALAHLERALALRPDRVTPHRSVAVVLIEQRRYAEALGRLDLVLAKDPKDVPALISKGVALINLDLPEAGLVQLRRVLELDPGHTVARTNVGAALVKLQRPWEAVEEYRRAITIDPDSPPPHFGLARTYLTLGQVELARDHYRVVQRLDPRLASRLRESFQ